MKKGVVCLLLLLIFLKFTYAAVPDSDADGVPDSDDNCQNSQTDVVDQFGCSCEQKNCPSDNNECTDDCSVVNGLPACGFVNNNKPCAGGYCSNGVCVEGTLCGNGIVEEGEQCDISSFGDVKNCNQYPNFIGGTLKCTSTCKIDTSGCISTPANITIATNTTSGNAESVLVIVAGIGNIQPTANAEQAKELVFGKDNSVNDYYNKASFGQVSLAGDVVGPYNLNESLCSPHEILDAAIKAADADVYFPKYSRIILDVPRTSCIWVGGEATIGNMSILTDDGEINASVSWDYEFTLHVVAHELGHNLGMAHANSMECFSCNSQEYGDFFDVMGNGNSKHINSPHKEELGWLGSDNIMVASEGEYLIKPLETKQLKGGIQQIKLPLKVRPSVYPYNVDTYVNKNAYYSLEFRQPIDYDIGYAKRTYEGVFIHLSQVPSKPYLFPPNLINYGYFDFGAGSLLQVGKTYKDESNNYDITLQSLDSNGALVKITGFTGTNQKPTGSFDGFKKIDFYEKGRIEEVAYGWAIDPDAPNEQIYVNVYVDGDIDKGWLFQSWKTSAEHEFEFSIPPLFKDGEPHEIHVYATDTWNGPLQELNNSPQIYQTEPKVPLLSITPTEIKEGDEVALKITSTQPYSSVIIFIKPSNKILPFGATIPSLVIDSTDSNGEFSTIESSLNWQPGSYDAWAKIGKFKSNLVTFAVTTSSCGNNVCEKGEDDDCLVIYCIKEPCPQPPCIKGTCPQDCQKQGCTDSDNGMDYNTKGDLTFNSQLVFTDWCNQADKLSEGYCDYNFDRKGADRWMVEDVSCPSGCRDGACMPAGLESYPKMFFKNNTFDGVFVVGDLASAGEVIAVSDIMVSLQNEHISVPPAKLASEICAGYKIPGFEGRCNLNQNIISVGSACSNAVTSAIEGNPTDCRQGLDPSRGKINLYSNNDYYHLAVKGYDDDRDTRAIAKVLANYKDYNIMGQEYNLHIEYKCTDSDGKDINVKGTAVSEGPAGFLLSISDYCFDEFSVSEALCNKDGTNFFNNYGCLYGCKEGACLPQCPLRVIITESQRFYDLPPLGDISNSGLTREEQERLPYIRKYIFGENYDSQDPKEYPFWAEYEALVAKMQQCKPQQACGDGVCDFGEDSASCPKDCHARCTDSDGGVDYYMQGTVCYGGSCVSDACGIDHDNSVETISSCSGTDCKLYENYCTDRSPDKKSSGEYYDCPIGCLDGACSPVPLCSNNVCEQDEETTCPQDCIPKEIEVKEPSSFSLSKGQSAKVVNYKDTKIRLDDIIENPPANGGGGKAPPPPPAAIAKMTVSNSEFSREYDVIQGASADAQQLKISFNSIDKESAMFNIAVYQYCNANCREDADGGNTRCLRCNSNEDSCNSYCRFDEEKKDGYECVSECKSDN